VDGGDIDILIGKKSLVRSNSDCGANPLAVGVRPTVECLTSVGLR